jgi:transposase InsO family protein
VSHANAALTPRARLKLARLIVDDGWPVARAAERFDVAWPTAKRWADRYRQLGEAGMSDRSSRPHRQPRKTPAPVVRKIVHKRWKHRLGPVAIAAELGVPASTVHAVLVRCRINRLSHIDRRTGEPIRRYEHAAPGDLLHVDVKKLGNIPNGGGWRYLGRQAGMANRHRHQPARNPHMGTAYVHTVLDDHSRVAYAEIHPDETAVTCAAFLHRAANWFHDQHHVTIRRVLTDNALTYRTSQDWTWVCHALQIGRRFTKPGCPWTNGKAERFNRTLLTDWAYAQPWLNTNERTAAFDAFLDHYNTRRGHTAAAGRPPITRLAA